MGNSLTNPDLTERRKLLGLEWILESSTAKGLPGQESPPPSLPGFKYWMSESSMGKGTPGLYWSEPKISKRLPEHDSWMLESSMGEGLPGLYWSVISKRLSLHDSVPLMLSILYRDAPIWDTTWAMDQLTLYMPRIMSDLYASGPSQVEASRLFNQIVQCSPDFVEFLTMNSFPQLQSASARLLASIAALDAEIVIKQDAVPIFLNLIVSTQGQVCEHALWALGNLAPEGCDEALPALINFVYTLSAKEHCSMLRNAAWALTNFSGKTPTSDVLRALKPLIHSSDEHVLADVCWTLSHASDITVFTDILCPLVKLLDHSSQLVIISALHTVGNIVARSQVHTEVIIGFGALSSLRKLLQGYYSQSIKKLACWTLSNIIVENLQDVLDADIIMWLSLIAMGSSIFEEIPNLAVKKEAISAISNAAFVASSDDQTDELMRACCVDALAELLFCPYSCIVEVCLEGLHSMAKKNGYQDWVIRELESDDGLICIMSLRETHEESHIRGKAKMFMDLYWKDRLEDYDYVDDDKINSTTTWRDRCDKRNCPFPLLLRGKGLLRVLNVYFDETRPIKRFPNWEEASSIKRVKVTYYHGTVEHGGIPIVGTGMVKDLLVAKKGKVIQIDFNKANDDIQNYLLELGIDVGGDIVKVVKELRKLFELFGNPNLLACLDIYVFKSMQREGSRREISTMLRSLCRE